MADKTKRLIADTFLAIADGLETGSFGAKPKIAVTAMGSEHGEETVMQGAVQAARAGADVYFIGTISHPEVTTVAVPDEDAAHKKMEELLETGAVDGAVTMHYPFPIGVSTVGRAVTPGKGKEMFIANTTGTSSTDRIEGMIKNAVYGIIAAKACGVADPTVGILNVDGARQTEGALKQLQAGGYPITFAESSRADGGCVMRGNDVLCGSADVMVTDSLTGNILSKMLSSACTGGSYEAVGYGYGPGIGKGYDRLVMIISRASGAPVIAGAISYAAQLVRGKVFEVAAAEFAAAEKAGLTKLLADRKAAASKSAPADEEVAAPPTEVVTAQLSGIEVMDLEDAVKALWKEKIYAQSGMGCTGPIILVSDANKPKAEEILKKAGYITQ
ncbi:glycine/betaine reductase C [Oscillospiraceae bacterium]|nr:glycine/betaine reductase C [Oscillospiraceae bacterium]BDF73622.1 glycine/betaine reductase C [Oscillospiraceae bacterium]